MDLESATVQKALSKKFPRKRCFKEVDASIEDRFSTLGQPSEKLARINVDVPSCLSYANAVSPMRQEKQFSECELERLRSLSPGNHDSYERYKTARDIQYTINRQSEAQDRLSYDKPYDLVNSGRTSNHTDFQSDHLSTLLTSNKHTAPSTSLPREDSVGRQSSHGTFTLSPIQTHIKNYLQFARTNIANSPSVFVIPNSNDSKKYENSVNNGAIALPESINIKKSHISRNFQSIYPHKSQLDDHPYKHNYLSPLCDLPCSSPVPDDGSVPDSNINTSPMCLRTASTVIIEAMANKLSCTQQRKHRSDDSEGDQCSRHYSVNSSPTSSKSSMDSVFSRRQMKYKQRYKNAFQSAHRDLLGGSELPSSPLLGEPPELIRISSDDGDYVDGDYDNDSSSESDDNNEDMEDSGFIPTREVPDTSAMSVDEILELIRLPNLSTFTADLDCVKSFLEPHQIGHINHLIKCYADAIFTVNVPPTVFESKVFSAIDYLDIHMSGVLQIYCIMFKSEDFLSLNVTDQVTLLQSCVFPAHIVLGFPLFKPDRNAWAIPSAMGSEAPYIYGIYNLLQILPKSEVSRLVALHETSHQLNVDWTISVLLLFIFMFTPIKKKIVDMENVENIRNTYVQLLYKYLEWKSGPQNAPLVFPEILKLMDAILRLCQDLEDFELWLKEDEVEIVQNRIKCFNLQGITPFQKTTREEQRNLIAEDQPMEYVCFSNIHSKMSSVLLKSYSVPSENSQNDSNPFLHIPLKVPSKNMFLESYESSALITNKIRQF